MPISENIKKLRERYGITQKELADIAGVTDKAVSTWELGIKEPRMGAIQKIVDHYGLKKSNIIEDNGMEGLASPTDEPSPEVMEILKRIERLSPSNLAKLSELIDLYLISQDKIK